MVLKYGCIIELESSFNREDAHRFYIKNGYGKHGYYLIRTWNRICRICLNQDS